MNRSVFAIGVNHSYLNSEERSRFSLSDAEQVELTDKLNSNEFASLVILNTCNRTEIYGIGDSRKVIETFSEIKGLSKEDTFNFFCYSSQNAINHIFKVVAGLDSQIIGDLEILGQCKNAFKNAKKQNKLSGYFERLGNTAIQAAKEIRTRTKISTGTVSLSYAATKLIKRKTSGKKCSVLLVGAGEFGKKIAYNIKDYLPKASLTVCNRTQSKAKQIADAINCNSHPFDDMYNVLSKFDIIISSVNLTGGFLIKQENLKDSIENKIYIDMSVPLSIDPTIKISNGNEIFTIDDLGDEVNSTMENRKEDIPLAENIIETHLSEFLAWSDIFEKSESIHLWKSTLVEISKTCTFLNNMQDIDKQRLVGKNMSDFANYIKQGKELPREASQLIHQFIQESHNPLVCIKAAVNNTPYSIYNCSECQSR